MVVAAVPSPLGGAEDLGALVRGAYTVREALPSASPPPPHKTRPPPGPPAPAPEGPGGGEAGAGVGRTLLPEEDAGS